MREARCRPSQPFVRAVGGFLLAICFVALFASGLAAQTSKRNTLLDRFARPAHIPHPAVNPATPAKIELGRRLFADPVLSANGHIACATCHDPKLAFSDGVARSTAGATGIALKRHTPALWNLAWAPRLYWDGRAASLEDQAQFPLSHPDEMASSADAAAARLARDASYRDAFRDAFGNDTPTGADVLQALAAYQRTLVSPLTRFDRWHNGDRTALSETERRGFALFVGKARCLACHSGFAFTDHGFHDIGLAGMDLGRGAHIDLLPLRHAFKTPTLRELVWTAPYMHDGSFDSLDAVVRHYERGGVQRPSRSRDMPKPFRLADRERADLVAFLESLSSETPPTPSREPWVGAPDQARPSVPTTALHVSQRDKTFAPGHVQIRRGETLTILNDDTRPHNVTISDPAAPYSSGAQEPGQSIALTFRRSGRHVAHCAIHPTMTLVIEVEDAPPKP